MKPSRKHTDICFRNNRLFVVKHEWRIEETEDALIDSAILTFPYWEEAHTIIIKFKKQ
jgi:hypothetical protein